LFLAQDIECGETELCIPRRKIPSNMLHDSLKFGPLTGKILVRWNVEVTVSVT
jgi:hypothetical protein